MALASVRSSVRLALALAVGLSIAACRNRGSRSPDGEVSEIEANNYIRRAIRQSSEGVILLPSQRAERVYELPRLNEIAQAMRNPAARCFLVQAIENMEPRTDGEPGFLHVPEGQLKARVRIAPSGEVLRTEVLESGFSDEKMEPCIQAVLEGQTWPPNKSGNAHYIDVVYWVSLGFQRGFNSEDAKLHMRREQVTAARRAKACLQGRVDAGRYEVGGLNLIDREGSTMVNRVDSADGLPESIRACIATALREIRLPRDPEAFVRPVVPQLAFMVDRDGTISVDGEQWLELVETEERARRAAEREALRSSGQIDELGAQEPGGPSGPIDAGMGLAVSEGQPLDTTSDAPEAPPAGSFTLNATPSTPDGTEEAKPDVDPAKPGLRLDLRGTRGGGG